MLSAIQCVADLRSAIAESPVWDEDRQALLWCDALGPTIFELEWTTRTVQKWAMPSEVGSLGLCESGRVIVALRDEICLFDRSSGGLRRLVRIRGMDHRTRLNDGKVGPDGAFWVGGLDDRVTKEPIASLYRVDRTGQVNEIRGGLIISNGLAWSADGRTMYHSDSRGCWIEAHDFDPQMGTRGRPRRIATPGEDDGRPDGATTDLQGCYWSCGVSAGRINRYSATGKLRDVVPVPVPAPTMPCFGGPDFRHLFFTSLRHGKSSDLLDAFPMSGGLFVAEASTSGTPSWRFPA